MKNKILILLMVATLLATAFGVQFGKAKAESSRPQLYFSSEDIPGLQALKDAPSHQAIWNSIKDWADPRVNDEPLGEMLDRPTDVRKYMTEYIRFYVENMTFMYYMTDDTAYLNAAKAWLLDVLNWSKWGVPGEEDVTESSNRMLLLTLSHITAFGYDALYDYLTTEERTDLRNMMIERIGELYEAYITPYQDDCPWNWNYPCTILITSGGIGMAGLALKGDWAGADDWIDFATFNVKRGLDTIGRDGATWEGHAYQARGLEGAIPFLYALKRVTGQDLFVGSHLDQVPYRYIYTTYNEYGLQFEDAYWGIEYIGPLAYSVDGYVTGRLLTFFYLLAAEYDDGYSQWFGDNYAVKYRMTSYLWKDPDIVPKPPDDLPLTKHFQDTGYVIWRTGWGDNDLLFAFKSGKGWGHAHPSQNSFGIYYQGYPLTCGVGYWLAAPTWPHNCILVDGQGQQKDAVRGEGEVLTVEDNSPYYRYLVGDAAAPYTGKLDKWLRHVVFMEPNYFVMYDEVAASSPKQFDWLLHAPYLSGGHGDEPSLSLSGDLITLTGPGGGDLKVKVVEPESFNYEIIPYDNNQSKQCYYAKVRPSTDQNEAQFLTVFFPDSVLSTDRVAVGNVTGVKVVNGEELDLILFSQDGNPVNEYIDLGGGYFQVIGGGGGNYSLEDTGIRVQFAQYLVLRLKEVASPVNDPPVLNPIGDKTAVEEETLQFTISAFDLDNDSLTYSASSLPSGANFDPDTQTFSWTPTSGQGGTYSVHFEVTDGELSDSEDTAIRILPDHMSISFIPPTEADGASIYNDWTEVNVSADDSSDTSSFIDWDESLVGYWDFNENSGTIAHDKSTYGNDGTLKNGPQWVSGKFGNALEFDGVDDYVEIPDNDTLNITDAMTVELWAKPVEGTNQYHYLISKWPGFMLIIKDNDLETFFYLSGVYEWYYLTANIPDYFDGNWHHLVGTYDKDGGIYKMKVYIDGVLYTGVAGVNGSIVNSGNPLTIGCKNPPYSGDYGAGFIDEVKIWSRALSEEEIKASYNSRIHDLCHKFTDLAGGTYQYYAHATDLLGNSAQTETRTITVVTGPNEPPVLDSIGDKPINEGQLLEFTATASDPDDDPLTFSISNEPPGASINPTTGVFSWTPSYSQAGTYANVQFTVTDGQDTDSENITITVNNVNGPPVLDNIGDKTVTEGETLQFTVSATDPDSDPLTFSADLASLPPEASFNPADLTFSWTPQTGEADTYSDIQFSVSDGSLTDFEDITIIVEAASVNPPPSGGGGGGGGAGGGGGGGTNGFTNVSGSTTSTGRFTDDVTAQSGDGKVELGIPEDTIGLNQYGFSLTSVYIKEKIPTPPPPEDGEIVGLAYDIGPSGTTFSPSINLTFEYDDTEVPEGVAEKNLVVATYDWNTEQWQDLESIIDAQNNTVMAKASHFSTFAVLAYTRPANFEVTDFTLTPNEVGPGETVTLSIVVNNNGDLSGTYEAGLNIDNTPVQSQSITLGGGESETVTFNITTDAAGEHQASIGSMQAAFVVKMPPTPAAFAVSELNIDPMEVNPGENINISVLVKNTGELSGVYQAILSVDNIAVQTKEVTLDGGDSEMVNFSFAADTAGLYQAGVGGLSAPFMVKTPPPLVPTSLELDSFSVVPNYHETTHQLAYVRVVYQMNQTYDSFPDAKLMLTVFQNGEFLEQVPLFTLSQLQSDGKTGELNYIPIGGWELGRYSFLAELHEGEILVQDIGSPQLIINPESGTTTVSLWLLGAIIGGATVIIAIVIGLVLYHRRDMLRTYIDD